MNLAFHLFRDWIRLTQCKISHPKTLKCPLSITRLNVVRARDGGPQKHQFLPKKKKKEKIEFNQAHYLVVHLNKMCFGIKFFPFKVNNISVQSE